MTPLVDTGADQTITAGNYSMAGDYAHRIIINTDGDVTITVTDDVNYTNASTSGNVSLWQINKVGNLTIKNDGHTVTAAASGVGGPQLLREEYGASILKITVNGGTYKSSASNSVVQLSSGGEVWLNGVTIDSSGGNAIYSNQSCKVYITGGSYSGSGDYPTLWNAGTLTVKNAKVDSTKSNAVYNKGIEMTLTNTNVTATNGNAVTNDYGTVTINGGTYVSESALLSINTSAGTTTNIHGGTFKGEGAVICNRGTMTIDETVDKTQISVTGNQAEYPRVGVRNESGATTTIDGATIQNAQYGIWKKAGATSVTLNDASFKNNENDIYLDEGETITIADSYTRRATVKVAEDAITEPRTLTTTGAQTLNLVSHNDGYYVAYDEANQYYVLKQRAEGKYIVDAERATAATADGTVLNANTEIAPETEVTLTADAPDEGWVFTGWQVASPTGGVDVTMPDGETKNLQDVTDTTVTFAMPASDVKVSAQYEYVGTDGGDGGAGAVVAGVLIGGTAYLLTTRVWLEGTIGYVPANRIELALGLWKHADCPDPVSTELYPDIDADDTDAQKAARWCVEQDLMKEFTSTNSDGTQTVKFKPYGYVFRPYSLVNWYKLEKLLKEQRAAEAAAQAAEPPAEAAPAETEAAAEAPAQAETTSEN